MNLKVKRILLAVGVGVVLLTGCGSSSDATPPAPQVTGVPGVVYPMPNGYPAIVQICLNGDRLYETYAQRSQEGTAVALVVVPGGCAK